MKGVRVNRASSLLAGVFLFLAVSVVSSANTIYVDTNSPNEPGAGTFDDPFRSIQDAIDDANNWDIIEVRPGLYTGLGNYDLDPNGKSITIGSTEPNNPDVVAKTIIDPNKAGRGFYFDSGEDANCIIEGLTIRNAYTGGKGGGIYCYYSSPTVTNCIISGNRANTHGGGIFSQNSSPRITGCVISGNVSAVDGGGIEWWRGEAELRNCAVFNNRATSGAGGGVDYFDCDNVVIANCTFAANTADRGGGLYCWSSNCLIDSSIFRGCEADSSGSQIGIYSGTVTVSYSDIEGGQEAISNISGSLGWADGNIDTDPCFACFDANGEPNLWDFHLQSVYGRWEPNSQSWVADSNTSPCIDAGEPNSDWMSEPWPNGKRINMGAYGGTIEASMNGNEADFSVDGAVDFADFAYLGTSWGREERCIEDLTADGAVDVSDLWRFALSWLWQE